MLMVLLVEQPPVTHNILVVLVVVLAVLLFKHGITIKVALVVLLVVFQNLLVDTYQVTMFLQDIGYRLVVVLTPQVAVEVKKTVRMLTEEVVPVV